MKVLLSVARFFDLDHPVKVALFAAEVLPTVGLLYAIVGHRPNVKRNAETGANEYFFEKLSGVDRLIYAAGEFYFSGHLMRGMKQSVFARGGEKLLLRAKNNFTGKSSN